MQVDKDKLGPLTTPLSARGMKPWMVYVAAVLGVIYMINPTAGLLEFIPDNLPIIGNLDEGVAAMLIWYALVEFFEGRNQAQ